MDKGLQAGQGLYAGPLAAVGNCNLSSPTKGNGLLTILENWKGYDEGDEVEVILLGPVK